MKGFRPLDDIKAEATKKGMRKVLILTALPGEMRAVRAHLTDLGSCAGRDQTIYECGQFSTSGSEWLVVVAECGAGTHAAGNTVNAAHGDFGGFDIAMVVGVAGSRKSDVPKGRVVASNIVYWPYSGKEAEEFSSRPRTYPIDHRLVSIARKVARDEDWPARIKAPLKENMPPSDVYPTNYPPKAIVAPIASIEAVLASRRNALEKKIAKYFGDASAVEMEGYGAVSAAERQRTPIILVRGISDMAGEDKTPENDAISQPIAAMHAAAFGFELLSAWAQIQVPERPILTNPDTPAGKSDQSEKVPSISTPDSSDFSITRLVLNFDGSAEDFPQERIDRILKDVQEAAGNNSFRIVGTEAGSFRLLIEGDQRSLRKIDHNTLQQKLAKSENVNLIGFAFEPEYRQLSSITKELLLASGDVLSWTKTLSDGTWINRPELIQLLNVIEEKNFSTTVLLGLPGSGKSALLSTLGEKLLEKGKTFLAIKADLLDPSVKSETDLQRQLNLSQLPSVLLQRLAAFQPVVLIIDQLDALAGYLDLKTGRLSVLLNLIRKLGHINNVHIVLSARTFEFEHDVRLRSVDAESIKLELPPWHVVSELLKVNGIKADGWPVDAQNVMRSPQSLSVLLKLTKQNSKHPFRKYQEVLDHFWTKNILEAKDGASLARLASAIAKAMAEEETLWIPLVRFEAEMPKVKILESLGVLRRSQDNGRIGFAHQTLFDHAIAREFAREKGSLSHYILSRQASLFVRPKLWAGLTYLRDVDEQAYESELAAIWGYKKLREHLRFLLIDFAGQQSEPINAEKILITHALENSPNREIALRAIVGSPGWFKLLKPNLAQAMTDDSNIVGLATNILVRGWEFAPEDVLSLVRSHWLDNPQFDGYSWHVLRFAPKWTEEIVNMLTKIVSRTEISPTYIELAIETIGVDSPQYALSVLLEKLNYDFKKAKVESERRLSDAKKAGETLAEKMLWSLNNSPTKPIENLIEDTNNWDCLEVIAKTWPELTLETLWPWFKEVCGYLRELHERMDKNNYNFLGFPIQYSLDFRFEDEFEHDLPEPTILGALRFSTEGLAAKSPEKFLAWMNQNEGENSNPAQRLFAHGLASQPKIFSSRALEFLMNNQNRLHLGHGGSKTTIRLIKNSSTFWSKEDVEKFEKYIIDYSPSAPNPESKTGEGLRSYLRAIKRFKFDLLRALPADKTSDETKSLIAEGRRAFRTHDKEFSSGFRSIGSPMSRQSMTKASDEDILNIFKLIPDGTGWDHPHDWGKGGNIQLSREFAEFSKSFPARAIELIKKFEPNVASRAAGYALEAMAENVDPDIIVELLSDLQKRSFNSDEFTGSAARAVERLVNREYKADDNVVAILEAWLEKTPLMNSEHADESSNSEQDDKPESREEIGSVLWNDLGFSVLPHGNYPILDALTRILLDRPDHEKLIEILDRHLDRAENYKVWRSLLYRLAYLRPENTAKLTNFIRKLLDRYPILIGSKEAAFLLAHIHWKLPDFVSDALKFWKVSQDPLARQSYGELITLIGIVRPNLDWAVAAMKEIMEDKYLGEERLGAAYAAIHLWNEPGKRDMASNLLVSLIPSADKRIWKAILDLFRIIDELVPDRATVQFLERFLKYFPVEDALESSYLVDRIETLLPYEAKLVGEIAKRMIEGSQNKLSDHRSGATLEAPHLVNLAITLHRLGADTRELGMHLYEELLKLDAYSARETLNEIDNRFRDEAFPIVRRRLARRARRTRRKN